MTVFIAAMNQKIVAIGAITLNCREDWVSNVQKPPKTSENAPKQKRKQKRNENETKTTKKRNENLRRRVLAEIFAKICAAV